MADARSAPWDISTRLTASLLGGAAAAALFLFMTSLISQADRMKPDTFLKLASDYAARRVPEENIRIFQLYAFPPPPDELTLAKGRFFPTADDSITDLKMAYPNGKVTIPAAFQTVGIQPSLPPLEAKIIPPFPKTSPSEKIDSVLRNFFRLIEYPAAAKEMRLEGKVTVKYRVAPSGQLIDVKFLSSNPIFEDTVRAAVQTMTYPENSVPPDEVFEHTIQFVLDED